MLVNIDYYAKQTSKQDQSIPTHTILPSSLTSGHTIGPLRCYSNILTIDGNSSKLLRSDELSLGRSARRTKRDGDVSWTSTGQHFAAAGTRVAVWIIGSAAGDGTAGAGCDHGVREGTEGVAVVVFKLVWRS